MTETLLIAARGVHYASLVDLAGLLTFTVLIVRPAALVSPFRYWAWTFLILALVSGFGWFLALAAGMSGNSLGGAFDAHILTTVLLKTRFGQLFLLRAGLAGITALALLMPRLLGRLAALTGAAALLASLAWAGHGADDQGAAGVLHLSADLVHLLAAGAWIGGLPPLVLVFHRALASEEREWFATARTATTRFSTLGIAAVGALLASGVLNASFLVGSVGSFLGTNYGRLLLVKIALFVGLVTLATINREVLMPRLAAAPRGAKRASTLATLRLLRRNSLLEAALGLGVLGIVAWLGTLVPAAHQQPTWPLPFRIDTAVFSAPEFRGQVWIALISMVLGLLLIAASFTFRRMWGIVVVSWLVIIAFFIPSAALLIVPAYPTSYFISPTGFTATAVADGAHAFSGNCTSCHGSEGRGDGAQAKSLSDPPADLTADHIYAHSDGELFWWLSYRMDGTPMPGFANSLGEKARWDLIDFIHANADGVRAAQGTPAAMPDFSIECPGTAATSMRASRGHIILLVFGPTTAREAKLAQLNLGADVITVIASSGTNNPQNFCATATPGLATAFSLYLVDRAKPIAGAEFLIDANGWLRALWQPSLGADVAAKGWNDPAALINEIAAIRGAPITSSARPTGHVH